MQLASSLLGAGINCVSCCQSLFSCVEVEVTHPFLLGKTSWSSLVDVTLLRRWSVHCRRHYLSTSWLLSSESESLQVYFCGSSHDPLSDGIVIAHVAIVEANCSLQTSLSESLQLFFRGSGTARLHGSCRQSDFSFSYALVGVGRLVISGNMSSCMLLCGWWRCDITRLYCWMGLLGWVFGAACCDSFTYRCHSLNYFCCPFLSSELSATGILLARRRNKHIVHRGRITCLHLHGSWTLVVEVSSPVVHWWE